MTPERKAVFRRLALVPLVFLAALAFLALPLGIVIAATVTPTPTPTVTPTQPVGWNYQWWSPVMTETGGIVVRPAGDGGEGATPDPPLVIPENNTGYGYLMCGEIEPGGATGPTGPVFENFYGHNILGCLCYAKSNNPYGTGTELCQHMADLYPTIPFTYTTVGQFSTAAWAAGFSVPIEARLECALLQNPQCQTIGNTGVFDVRGIYYGQPIGCDPVIYDNGMEQYPDSDYWSPFNDAGTGGDEFARLSDSNILHRIFYGTAYCGSHMHLTGVWDVPMFSTDIVWADPIEQSFCWPGGNFYWGAVARRKANTSVNNIFQDAGAQMTLKNGVDTVQLWEIPVGTNWTTIGGTYADLPPGNYTLNLYMDWDTASWPFVPYLDQYESEPWVVWDNFQIGQLPVDPVACYDVPNPDATPTVTPTPAITPTPTCVPYEMTTGSCGFNQGSTDGWQTIDGLSGPFEHSIFGDVYFVSYVDRAVTDDQGLGHWPGATYYVGDFRGCGDGRMYIDFYSWGIWRIRVRNTSTGQIPVDFVGGNIIQWDLHHYSYSLNIPPGSYEFIFSAVTNSGVFFDSFAVGSGTGVSCDFPAATITPGPSPTYTSQPPPSASPTPGGPTLTATVTPNRPTNTPTPTRTPIPSFTAFVTWTPRPPSATAPPAPTATSTVPPVYPDTPTMPPTDTVMPGTDTPTPRPTYTQPATYTPQATSSPIGPTPTWPANEPPQQPPPSCYTTCIRPVWGAVPSYEQTDGILGAIGNLWYSIRNFGTNATTYVAGWIDYTRCNGLSFIVWCPEHTESMAAVPTEFAAHEPFGTINEVEQSFNAVATVYNQYNWANTGVLVEGTPMAANHLPNLEAWQVISGNNPYNGGLIDITGQNPSITGESSTSCEMQIGDWVGPGLTQGMCFAFTTLNRLGVLGWFQFTVNLCAIIMLVMYIMRRWVNASTGSG